MHQRTLINRRYELEDLPLARGGMGEVWIGRDIKLEREVAVKFVRFPDEHPDKDLVRRFVRESRITARLEHPGVPAVYDVGTHEGRPYLVMQRIRGISVADLIAEQGPLPIGWATAIAAQACSVLSVAHQASLVHRDLKPRNLMLDPDGCVKVLDFGIAVALDRVDISNITVSGQTLGTPAYMAPEQILAGMSGPQTDLYALGCTLFEMLAGHPLFVASTSFSVMNMQVNQRPLGVRTVRSDAPAELERLLFALLQKKPEDRPPSADDVYQRLLQFANGLGAIPGTLKSPSAPSPTRMYARVLSRVFDDPAAATAKAAPRRRPAKAGAGVLPSRAEMAKARQEATQLMEHSRYSQAAEVLTKAVAAGGDAYGAEDDEVVGLRTELATALFEGGEYRRAAPVYHQLAHDLAARSGDDAEPVLRFRLQEATCNALIGETTQALGQLGSLLTVELRVFGEDDQRTLELRRQIGLLQLGAGQREAAEQTLRAVVTDTTRVFGATHPTVTAVTAILDGLRAQG